MTLYKYFCGTQVGGYLNKKMSAAFQGVVLDKHGSDCGTSLALEIIITASNKSQFLHRYIVVGSKLVLLDSNNIDNYVNKKVRLRSPMYCKGDRLCNKCAGELYYKLGIENIGLTSTKLAGTLLNLNMKKFHNTTASITRVNLDDIDI